MNRIPTIIESICFLLNNLGTIDKIHLVKLMYLADKYHLMNYGRTITGDDFIALPNGPAGSKTTDVLEYDSYILGEHINYAQSMFYVDNKYQYTVGKKCNPEALEMLSESDKEALDFAAEHFGKMDKWDVVKYTHELPEWKQFKLKFDEKSTNRELIKTEEVLLNPKDKYFSIPQDHVEQSLEILTGTFDL
jgi:uncharacterized phage-associated protein